MEHFFTLISCCLVLLFLNEEGACLRCRSGNQQVDRQFQKALKTCRQRYIDMNNSNEDFISSNDDSSESGSNSEENVYERNFFYKKRDKQFVNNQRYRNRDRNSDTNIYLSEGSSNEKFRELDDTKQTRKTTERSLWNSKDSRMRKSDFNNGDSRYGNNTGHEQTCIIQCFFNELNVVDRKGFPERDFVIPMMSRNIRDPELKDFVEESIIECFRYLESYKRDKCEFSQNLLKCLAEKGQEKCDDWED